MWQHRDTIGVGTRQDSRERVQANTGFFGEIASFEKHCDVFYLVEDSLLGVWEDVCQKHQLIEGSPEWKQKGLRRMILSFWLSANMAAWCAVLGHGCAGNESCGHCKAKWDPRRISYVLVRVPEAVSFKTLAEDYDMWPSTLYQRGLSGPERCDGRGDKGNEEGRADVSSSCVRPENTGVVVSASRQTSDDSR